MYRHNRLARILFDSFSIYKAPPPPLYPVLFLILLHHQKFLCFLDRGVYFFFLCHHAYLYMYFLYCMFIFTPFPFFIYLFIICPQLPPLFITLSYWLCLHNHSSIFVLLSFMAFVIVSASYSHVPTQLVHVF